MPTLDWRITGCEFAITLTAGTVHCTRTQGCGLPGGTVNAQPTIVNWSAMVAAIARPPAHARRTK